MKTKEIFTELMDCCNQSLVLALVEEAKEVSFKCLVEFIFLQMSEKSEVMRAFYPEIPRDIWSCKLN